MTCEGTTSENKRYLTETEIEDLIHVIKPAHLAHQEGPVELSQFENSVFNARESLRKQLVKIQLYPHLLSKFKDEIRRQYYRSVMAPGEMVGIVAASSIGEQNTQASLNSFHSSGAFKANLTDGLARLNELMNATQNIKTPSLIIYFNRDVKQDLEVIRRLAFTKLIWVELQDLIVKVVVKHKQDLDQLEPWYDLHTKLVDDSYLKCDWRIRLVMNPLKLWRHQITMQLIARKILETNQFDNATKIGFVYSHESVGIFDIWLPNNVEDIGNFLNLKDNDRLNLSFSDTLKMKFFINKVVLPNILPINLSGVTGLKECYYTETKKEWRIDTKGGRLKDLLTINCLDLTRCRSNHMHEIYELFGVEATKQMLRDEFAHLISKVNPRHLELLIDSMTYTGTIQRVTRNGIDRKQVGAIAKASFEQPVDNFLISATAGEMDPLRGVSAAITVGKQAQIGTGFMRLIEDKKKLYELLELNQMMNTQSSSSFIDDDDVQRDDDDDFEHRQNTHSTFDEEDIQRDDDDDDDDDNEDKVCLFRGCVDVDDEESLEECVEIHEYENDDDETSFIDL